MEKSLNHLKIQPPSINLLEIYIAMLVYSMGSLVHKLQYVGAINPKLDPFDCESKFVCVNKLSLIILGLLFAQNVV